MHSFELQRHRHATAWLDEAPPADFSATSLVRRVLRPQRVVAASRRIAGAELNIPHGPRASYGLLGAELVDARADGLEVVVSINKVGHPLERSLALQPDKVNVGLLEEYANAVIDGVAKTAESSGLPTNASLQFRWAAHDIVGSSSSIFERVSAIVMGLLLLPQNASNEQIEALFE